MFRINTDTAFAGTFMRIEKKGSVFRYKFTNNGTLLAVAAKYAPSMLYGGRNTG